MKKKSLFFVFLCSALISILFINSCIKEYSYEGGAFSHYSLIGTPDECTAFILNGVYAAGIALDSSNYVQVQVQVTGAGNYTITTNTIDGITFSASGNFPDTGIYNVVLKAAGTADSAGTYQMQIIGDSSCYFPLTVNAKPMAGYTLSGDPGDCDSPVILGSYNNGMPVGSLNTLKLNVNVLATGDYTITTDTVAGIFFSSSGVFTSTGNQQITLNAQGKLNEAGLIYFHVHGGNSACSFKLPVTNAEPLATYVLESGFGDIHPCTPQEVNGDYTVAIPLSSANTVDIGVYVKYTGNYSISTDSTNGMIFKSSGQFAVTGEQTVTLYGTGTPRIIGTFSFSPQIIGPSPLGGAACGFDINVK